MGFIPLCQVGATWESLGEKWRLALRPGGDYSSKSESFKAGFLKASVSGGGGSSAESGCFLVLGSRICFKRTALCSGHIPWCGHFLRCPQASRVSGSAAAAYGPERWVKSPGHSQQVLWMQVPPPHPPPPRHTHTPARALVL